MQRDYSIDILKFLAVFLIINSHMDELYPSQYKIFATGGAIGDCLFLFCSGYTLLLSKRQLRFDNWYKQRIKRIYPSVIICAVTGSILGFSRNISIMTLCGGEFILAIMSYYILIFFIRKYAQKNIPSLLISTYIISLIVYIIFFPYKYETGERGIYGITTLYRWLPYFSFMLLGAWIGLKHNTIRYNSAKDFSKMMICLILFYGIQFLSTKNKIIAPYQIITLIPLLGIVYYSYKCCNANFLKRLYDSNYGHIIIMTISGLCLESYLVQYSVFTTKMNSIFPLNLPIMIIIVLIVSFICKCLSRLFAQTFSNEDYNWTKIFRLY